MPTGRPPALQRYGKQGRRFRDEGLGPWLGFVLAALVATAFLPILWPTTQPWLHRTTPILSLFFFLAAVGFWLRMGRRSFVIAAALTTLVYLLTAWLPGTIGYEDFFVIALLSSFLIFALAGFNLIFILEEVVYDLQRLAHLRHPAWRFGPTLLVLAMAWGLAFVPALRAVWITALIDLVVLGGWWFVRAFNPIREGPVLKELHLMVLGTLTMAALFDITGLVRDGPTILPEFLAFFTLVGTWLYVTYTTLQRTHFLLGGSNAVPWLLIMLSASFALVQHASFHFRIEKSLGVAVLLQQRVAYLVIGMAIGVAVYVAEAAWRVFRSLRDDRRLSPQGRIIAGRFARLAEGVFHAEQRILEGTAYQVYAGMDRLLPGPQVQSQHGWELDVEEGKVRRIGEEE